MPSDFGIGSARVNGGHTPPVSSETSCQLSSPSRRDREFESRFLQRRVLCEPTWSLAEVFRGDVVAPSERPAFAGMNSCLLGFGFYGRVVGCLWQEGSRNHCGAGK